MSKTNFDATVDFESTELETELTAALARLGEFDPADGIALHIPANPDRCEAELVCGDTEFANEREYDDWVLFTGARDESLVVFFAREIRARL